MHIRTHIPRSPWFAFLLAWGVFGVGPVTATQDAKGLFPPAVEIQGRRFLLSGTGVLRYLRMIPIYDAALYTADNGARRIEVVYRVSAKAEQFAKAGDEVLARTFNANEIEALAERLDRINSWYPDPQKGDRCAITYIPEKGTELTFNGESLGRIEGTDFADAYFSIWLGEDPACPRLRSALLGPRSTETM